MELLSQTNNSLFYRVFKYSYKLLNKQERLKLRNIAFLSFWAGIFEIIAVTSVYPLVSIIIEPDLIEKNKFINKIYVYFNYPSQNNFVIYLAIGASIILIGSVFLNLLAQISAIRNASSAEERLSNEFYKDLIYSPYKWHLQNNPNNSRNIILRNMNIWSKVIIRSLPSLAGQISGILIAFITVIVTTPKLGFILFLTSGFFLTIFLRFIRNKTNKLMRSLREKQSELNIFLTESFTGIKDIKLSSNEENFIKIFSRLNHVIIKNFSSASNWNSLPSYLVILFGQLIILLTSVSLFILGIKGGELAAIVAIVLLVFSKTIPLVNKLGGSLTGITNYGSFVDEINEIKTSLETEKDFNKINNNYIRGSANLPWKKIYFSSVEFSYPQSQKSVLRNLNFEIKKGLHYAFVGTSGSGKSTSIDLFLGLLEPIKGKILIDGIELKDFGIRNWQKKISYVPQDPLICDLTLRENIAFGIPKGSIDDKRVLYCLKQTRLLKVCKSLKNGIYTNLGNSGISLSGGQKQRVAISRALYQRSEILVLDEATSSLDTKTEESIQKTIGNLKSKMTIISIAHRFSTIKNCDLIFLLDNGRVKEKGSFQELNNKSKLFRDLSKAQFLETINV